MSSGEQPVPGSGVEADVLGEQRLRELIISKNRDTLAGIVRQLRSPLGVIPFVGAGMSATVKLAGDASRLPQWGELLTKLADGRSIGARVKSLLEKGDFEGAASMVDKDRPGVLSSSIRDAFDREVRSEDLNVGPLSYLPFLARGPVITTNFDRVLEQVFSTAKRGFDSSILGPRPDETIAAIHSDSHVLIKIHGDCRDRTSRIFTVEEYERAYGAETEELPRGVQTRIGSLAWLLFTNRPLLFLGCSLERDRTVQVLGAIQQRLPGLTHYAVLAAEKSVTRWEERERRLDELGVRALWFYPGHYEEIEILLREMLERASTRPLGKTADKMPLPHSPMTPPISMASIQSQLRHKLPTPRTDPHAVDLRLITDALFAGKLAFFLGAYASLDQSFLGREFYDRIAQEFDCPLLAGDRTAVAGYVIRRYGSETLWQAIRSFFKEKKADPSVLHRFIAALPTVLREHNAKASLCVATTNYDTLMEQALIEAGETFQLLYYINVGVGGEGCFVERSTEGAIRQVERAENLRFRDSSQHLVVKLNGGLSYFTEIDEQASVERAQFERLAARIPAVLPGYLREELQARSMLFLGHGLAEPDIHALVSEYAKKRTYSVGSWAVQLAPTEAIFRQSWNERARDWGHLGLKLLDDDLEQFIARLERRVNERVIDP